MKSEVKNLHYPNNLPLLAPGERVWVALDMAAQSALLGPTLWGVSHTATVFPFQRGRRHQLTTASAFPHLPSQQQQLTTPPESYQNPVSANTDFLDVSSAEAETGFSRFGSPNHSLFDVCKQQTDSSTSEGQRYDRKELVFL